MPNSLQRAARFIFEIGMADFSSTKSFLPVLYAVATGPLPFGSRRIGRDSEQNVLSSPRTFLSASRREGVT
jgi:hypothetical protein